MKLQDALRRAQALGLDLVEVAPNANPPVCKIVDFGKYRYDLSKQDKDRKSTGSRLKEIKFRVNIDPHDYGIKVRHAEEFLERLGGKGFAQPNPRPMFPNPPGLLRLEPYSEGLRDRIWWGAGSRAFS